MKSFKYFLIAAATIVLAACSGGGSMSPASEKIQGPLGAYFEIVSKEYKVKDGKVSIEIKRIQEGFPAPWENGMKLGYGGGEYEPQFTIEFQDADGNVVSKEATDKIWDSDELDAIAALGVDETATITFDCKEDATQFKMGSAFKVNEADNSSSISYSSDDSDDSSISADESFSSSSDDSSDDDETLSSSSKSSTDWDSMLKSYEQYVDKYISLAKKAAKGDMSAMSEYPGLMQKAEELSKKIDGAKGEMSASQLSRYMKINNKMLKAAQEMQ